jgi:curved DNA-binding protein CbpA
MSAPTHYEVLKLRPGATPAQIRTAYKNLSRLYHPDMNPNNPKATGVMATINASYDVLSNPELRKAYDATLTPAVAPVRGKASAPTAPRSTNFVMPEPDDAPVRPPKKKAPRRVIDTDAEQREGDRAFLALMAKRAFTFFFAGALIVCILIVSYGGNGQGNPHEWLILRALRQMFTGI